MKTLGDLLVGARVVDNNTKYDGNPIIWRIIGKNHEGDPENSVTLISEYILCSKSFDAKEPKNTNTSIQNSGNANYKYSNILQWLNSDSDAWMWYTPQHESDHPPDTTNYVFADPYESEPGFLNGFSLLFKKNMIDADNVYSYGSTISNVKRKIHLLSQKEIGLQAVSGGSSNESRIYEGEPYSDFFYDNTSRKAYQLGGSEPKSWSLRTYVSASNFVVAWTDGGIVSRVPYGVYGVRPKCFLPIYTMVSEKPDENGIYTLILKSEGQDKPDVPEEDEETPPDGKWREPKTDWVASDRFNLKDYNRIRNNLIYLNRRISNIWGEFSIEDMGNDQSSIQYIWKPKYFNAIENSLEILNKHNIVVKNYGFKQTFYQNGAFIGFAELNRIESATLQMKQIIEGWEAGLRQLSFRLGSPKGLRS